MKLGLADLSVTELVGTTAVVLSLIFVGVGIRDSNREARAATIQAALNADMHLQEVLTQYASVWDKILSEESLGSGEENRRGIVLYNMFMTANENRFHQINSGILDAQAWEIKVAALVPVVNVPMYEQWKTTPGSKSHTADFLEFIEGLKEGDHE